MATVPTGGSRAAVRGTMRKTHLGPCPAIRALGSIAGTVEGDPQEAAGEVRGLADAPAAVLTRWRGPADQPTGCSPTATPTRSSRRQSTLVPAPDPAYRRTRRDPQRQLRCWVDLDFDYGRSRIAVELLGASGLPRRRIGPPRDPSRPALGDLHNDYGTHRRPSPAAMQPPSRSRGVLAQLCLTDSLTSVGEGSESGDVVCWCSRAADPRSWR
jgi:hypothetical protein